MNSQQGDGIPVSKLTEEENAIVREAFKENEALLKSIRALFFGLGVTDDEKQQIKGVFEKGDMLKIITKKFLPTPSKDTPIGQVQDVWLGAEQMVYGSSPTTIVQALQYKSKSIEMSKKALALLTNPDGDAVSIVYKPWDGKPEEDPDPLGIELLARNQYMRHVEAQLTFLWIIANQKPPPANPKEAAKRAAQDSTK
jgi:hypothetical protein